MNGKRIFTALLAALLMTACAPADNTDPVAEETQPATEAVQTETEAETLFVPDELPELDYNNADVHWLCGNYTDAYFADIWADAENGNGINDALFRARMSVEERLNMSLHVESFDFVWNTLSTFLNHLKSLVMSGDTTYDCYIGYTAGALMLEGGYFADMQDNRYMDLDKPWWNQEIQDIMPGDAIYTLTGDAMMTLFKHCLCLYFNDDLKTDLGITEDLYQVVREGKWTLDKMEAVIADTYVDLNGDGRSDPEDQFGLTFGDTNKYRMVPAAMHTLISTKTADGYEFSLLNERNNDAFTRFQKLITENPNSRDVKTETDSTPTFGGNFISNSFTSGHALFTASLIGDAGFILDSSDFTLGLVPYPKYDEQQANYRTAPQRPAVLYIPITIAGDQFDRAGAVLEAWSSECYRSVMPTYFEVNLKSRYSTDNNMAEMFDLLKENTSMNLDYLFSTELPLNVDIYKNTTASFVSYVESKQQSHMTALAEMVAALRGEAQ